MTAYQIVAVIHAIVAVGGLGQISVLAFLARKPHFAHPELMRRLFKAVGGSLVIMLITGVALLWLSDWVYEHTWWFRISVILFLLLGAMHGIGQATVKKIEASGSTLASSPLIGKLRKVTLIMSLTLMATVFLMEGKPF
jgi:hypothetical protein